MNDALVIIAGPTATGKSALALSLAPILAAEIVNADSQQVYRGMDIGTGKPSESDRARVAHHLYDVAHPWEQFDAARFVAEADRLIGEIRARGRVPLLVGGTGLWLRALIRGLVEAPSRDDAFRAQLESEAARVGWPKIHERLRTIDPISAERIRPSDPVRITRAIEVFELTGVTLSSLHEKHQALPPRYHARFLAIDLPGPDLEGRIAARVRTMFEAGLLDETRRLADEAQSVPRLERVMGYREALMHLRGTVSIDQAMELTVRAQRQYAKRQRTWFKAEPQWRWLTAEETAAPETIAALVDRERP